MNKLYEMARYVVESEYPYLNSLETGKIATRLYKTFLNEVDVFRDKNVVVDRLNRIGVQSGATANDLNLEALAALIKRYPQILATISKERANPEKVKRILSNAISKAVNTLPEVKKRIMAMKVPTSRDRLVNRQPLPQQTQPVR